MYSKQQLLNKQKTAELALEKSQALETKFADRFKMASSLFFIAEN